MTLHRLPSQVIELRTAYVYWTRGGLAGFAQRNHDIDDTIRAELENTALLAALYERGFVSATFRNLEPEAREALISRKSVTVAEAAAQLEISPQAVRKAIQQGRLPAELRGRHYDIATTDLAFYQAQRIR